MVTYFDQVTKREFHDSTVSQRIRFGTAEDNDTALDVRRGQLRLSG